MAYSQFNLIEAIDFNTLAGGNPTATPNTLNATWATGSGSAGYGQTAVSNVSIGSSVTASNWAELVNRTSNAAAHQGSSISTVVAPSTGGAITALSAIPTNLTTIYNNRLNAAAQGSTVANTVTTTSTWSDRAVWTHTVAFANGNAARYFFNSGGQIKITMSHPNGSGINLLLNNLASNVGTVVMSAPFTGTINVAGIAYNGITKIGGGGTPPSLAPDAGYYAQLTSPIVVFAQTASTGPSGYLSTDVRISTRTNGPQTGNGDNGSVITIEVAWDQIPNGLVVSSGSSVTVAAHAPSTNFIANTWGSVSVTGSVSVS